jgi:hypothetical protein
VKQIIQCFREWSHGHQARLVHDGGHWNCECYDCWERSNYVWTKGDALLGWYCDQADAGMIVVLEEVAA